MVGFLNAEVDIYEETTTLDESGDYIADFVFVETIVGDVQPHTLTQDEISVYGITTGSGNIRLFLYNGLHPNVKVGNRAKVKSDFTGTEEWFSIMPINAWSKHGECLLVPVENESNPSSEG